MDIELNEIYVSLSDYQKTKIDNAVKKRENIMLILKKDALEGSDIVQVPLLDDDDEIIDFKDHGSIAYIDESTYLKLWEEFYPGKDWEKEGERKLGESKEERERRLENNCKKLWEHFGFRFRPLIESETKHKGLHIHLNYSLFEDE